MKILVEGAAWGKEYSVNGLPVDEFPFVSVLNREHLVFLDNVLSTTIVKKQNTNCEFGWVLGWEELQTLLETLDRICVEYQLILIEDDEESPLDWRRLCKSKGFDLVDRWG